MISLAIEVRKFITVAQEDGVKTLQPGAALAVMRILKIFPSNVNKMLPPIILSMYPRSMPCEHLLISLPLQFYLTLRGARASQEQSARRTGR